MVWNMPTIDDIRGMDKDFLTPAEVSGVLRADPQTIRTAAKQRPELLGFPVAVIGSRVKIPRKPFLAFMEGKA